MLSFVIPVKDEAASLPVLYTELLSVIKNLHQNYEIIFINDGSTDRTKEVLNSLSRKNSHLSTFHFRANFGKSEALAYGFSRSRGDIIIMLDADLQDNPTDIPILLNKLKEGYDLVVGWRKKRKDNLIKKISSLLFNSGTRWLSKVNLHDYNCGLKVLKREVANQLHLHGELHRFIPVLAAKLKYKVTEIPVRHRFRRFGVSKFGIGRSWRAVIDLLTVLFLTHYEGKPAHFFGLFGFLLAFVGFIFNAYVAYIRITTGTTGNHIPLLLAGILFMMVGFQLISIGLIAEMITNYRKNNPTYEQTDYRL